MNPDKHHRKSIRLKGYDYSQPGVYYLTICVQDRDCLLGKVINNQLKLNDAGKMINHWWNKLPHKFTNVELNEYIIMPNHLHGIISVGADPRICPDVFPENQNIITQSDIHIGEEETDLDGQQSDPGDIQMSEYMGSGNQPSGEHASSPLRKPVPLSQMIQWLKTMTTNEYLRHVKQNDWQPFNKRLWQRNYYEHIVRDENELDHIRKYIIHNPLNWDSDEENPHNKR